MLLLSSLNAGHFFFLQCFCLFIQYSIEFTLESRYTKCTFRFCPFWKNETQESNLIIFFLFQEKCLGEAESIALVYLDCFLFRTWSFGGILSITLHYFIVAALRFILQLMQKLPWSHNSRLKTPQQPAKIQVLQPPDILDLELNNKNFF